MMPIDELDFVGIAYAHFEDDKGFIAYL